MSYGPRMKINKGKSGKNWVGGGGSLQSGWRHGHERTTGIGIEWLIHGIGSNMKLFML